MHHLTINYRPTILAAILVEQGESIERIGIHPKKGHPDVFRKEVEEIKHERQSEATIIVINSKNNARLNIERDMDKKHPLHLLTTVFEREMSLFLISVALWERSHILGLSPLQPAFFPETKSWDETQGKILSFFLPFMSQIRGDWLLTGKCLSAALELLVHIKLRHPKILYLPGTIINECLADPDSKVGGMLPSDKQCIMVNIGPVNLKQLATIVPGTLQRRFLEEALLPQLLPEDYDCEINITVKPEYNKFCVSTSETPHYADINSIIA